MPAAKLGLLLGIWISVRPRAHAGFSSPRSRPPWPCWAPAARQGRERPCTDRLAASIQAGAPVRRAPLRQRAERLRRPPGRPPGRRRGCSATLPPRLRPPRLRLGRAGAASPRGRGRPGGGYAARLVAAAYFPHGPWMQRRQRRLERPQQGWWARRARGRRHLCALVVTQRPGVAAAAAAAAGRAAGAPRARARAAAQRWPHTHTCRERARARASAPFVCQCLLASHEPLSH